MTSIKKNLKNCKKSPRENCVQERTDAYINDLLSCNDTDEYHSDAYWIRAEKAAKELAKSLKKEFAKSDKK